MRTAIVGLGDIGLGAHVPALRRHPDIELVLGVDQSAERREVLAAEGVPTAAEFSAVLAAEVDGVVLATPPWVTPALAIEAARVGLFVLAEKPVAVSVEAAAGYDELTAEQRRRIQVGLTYRHDPAIQQLGAWIADGVLGGPVVARAHIYDEQLRPDDLEHTERITATLGHGSPVVHEGAHVFDWLSHLLGGQPSRVDDRWAVTTRPALPAANLIGACLTYPQGHVALVEFGWFTSALPRCELSILGDRGLAVLDLTTFELTLNTGGQDVSLTFSGDRTARCFDQQVQRFVDLIDGGLEAGEPSLDDGIHALRTAQLIAEAAGGQG